MRYRLPLLLVVAALIAFAFRPVPNGLSRRGGIPILSAKAAGGKINWISFKEAYERNQKAPRKMVIDVYTGWCGWCKVMDQRTFSQPAVIDYVNDHYYAVKLDAEMKEDVTIGDKTFKYQEQSRAHELAISLLQGKMGYPTTVFLNEKMEMIQPISGYLEPRLFHQIITYFGGNYQTKEQFDAYKAGTYVKEYQAKM